MTEQKTNIANSKDCTPTHYFQILAFNSPDDIDYNCSSHIHPSYVSCMLRTGYYKPFGVADIANEPLMLQSNFADGLTFTEIELLPEIVLKAKTTWPNKEFHVITMDSLVFGKQRPRWLINR